MAVQMFRVSMEQPLNYNHHWFNAGGIYCQLSFSEHMPTGFLNSNIEQWISLATMYVSPETTNNKMMWTKNNNL